MKWNLEMWSNLLIRMNKNELISHSFFLSSSTTIAICDSMCRILLGKSGYKFGCMRGALSLISSTLK